MQPAATKMIKTIRFTAKCFVVWRHKRKEIHEQAIKRITEIYGEGKETSYCKIFDNDDFGYHRITVERPSRNEKGKIILDKKRKCNGRC